MQSTFYQQPFVASQISSDGVSRVVVNPASESAHVDQHLQQHRHLPHTSKPWPYIVESYGQWLALTVLLSSLGVVMNNTGKERRLATLFIVTAIFILLWSTPFYFINRWHELNLYMLIGMIIIVALLFSCCIWSICHIWDPVLPC